MRAVLVMAALAVALPAQAAEKAPPYWASIVPNKARTRTGPGRNFPGAWLYQRSGLPVRVIATYPNWRKITDPDGATGWIQSNMLSDKRTALVIGSAREMREHADDTAKIAWRVAPGVVGAVSECDSRWCRFETAGKVGFVPRGGLWGLAPGEQLP
ncbi:SH3 domain-containing protein [Sphingomonas antarctica]|uniref:SH3 domain-containing protein n=1 Tax=Sphingomonas antarctica TaxID=2040274 RepID=UPI0039ECDD7B